MFLIFRTVHFTDHCCSTDTIRTPLIGLECVALMCLTNKREWSTQRNRWKFGQKKSCLVGAFEERSVELWGTNALLKFVAPALHHGRIFWNLSRAGANGAHSFKSSAPTVRNESARKRTGPVPGLLRVRQRTDLEYFMTVACFSISQPDSAHSPLSVSDS